MIWKLPALWSSFWFSEVNARSLAAMRIGLGLLLIAWQLSLWPQVETLLAPWGAVDGQMLQDSWTVWGASYLGWVTEPWQLHLLHGLGLAVAIAWTLGWRTRITGWLCLLLMVSVWHRNPWIHNGGDRLLRISLFYMALVPCGAAWSLDANRNGTRETVPIIGHRLIQLQWALMYTYTGIAKISGSTWHGGTALYYSLSDTSYVRAPALFDGLLTADPVLWLTYLATWVTLAWEVLFVPLVVIPRTRPIALGLGLFFHLGIFATIDVAFFSLVSMWGYLAFVDPSRFTARRLSSTTA